MSSFLSKITEQKYNVIGCVECFWNVFQTVWDEYLDMPKQKEKQSQETPLFSRDPQCPHNLPRQTCKSSRQQMIEALVLLLCNKIFAQYTISRGSSSLKKKTKNNQHCETSFWHVISTAVYSHVLTLGIYSVKKGL